MSSYVILGRLSFVSGGPLVYAFFIIAANFSYQGLEESSGGRAATALRSEGFGSERARALSTHCKLI